MCVSSECMLKGWLPAVESFMKQPTSSAMYCWSHARVCHVLCVLCMLCMLQESSRVRAVLAAHDFSSARAAIVASVPGWHSGTRLSAYGHMRLRALLAKVGMIACTVGFRMGVGQATWLCAL
jgi:hypothetical protein